MVIHPSSVEGFLACGESYRLRYIEGAPRTVPPVLLIGSAFHSALHNDALSYIRDTKFLDGDTVIRLAEPLLQQEIERRRAANEEIEIPNSDPLEMAFVTWGDHLRALLGVYLGEVRVLPEFRPTGTEIAMTATLDLGGAEVQISGKADMIDADNRIWDYKTKAKGGKIPKTFDARTSLQANLYLLMAAQAIGSPCSFRYIYIRDNACKWFDYRMDEETEVRTLGIVELMARSIDSKLFLPAAQDASKVWHCSYCDVRKWCKYTLFRT